MLHVSACHEGMRDSLGKTHRISRQGKMELAAESLTSAI